MGKDKHQPKNTKGKFTLSNDAEKILIGIMITLISIIGLLNKGVVGEFLTFSAVYVFGAFYYFFYLFLIFFGIYLAVLKKPLSIKVNLYLLGGILFVLSLMMIASLSIDNLTIRTLFGAYNNQMDLVSSSMFRVTNFSNLGATGGGFVGAFIVSLLNSAITSIGTRIVGIFLLVVSLILLLKNPIKMLFSFIKKKLDNRKKKVEEQKEEKKEEIITPIEEEVKPAPLLSNPADDDFVNTSRRANAFHCAEPSPLQRQPLVDEKEVVEPVIAKTEPAVEPHHNSFFGLFRKPREEKVPEIEKESIATLGEIEKLEEPAPRFSEPEPQQFTKSTYENTEPARETSTTVLDDRPKVVSKPSTERKYILPSISMLSEHRDDSKNEINIRESSNRANQINNVFNDFKIKASVISYTIGPSVTRFNVRTDPGVRVNTISGLVKEIQVGLNGDKSVRIETVVQGKDTSGIEVGNVAPTPVSFKDCFASISNSNADKLVVPIGQDINREVITTSIDDLPHLLVAGTTGSGKSVFVHSMIMTLIMRNYPDELRLILIDPKKVEFSKYNNIPHLYCPIITEPLRAVAALHKLINEMERRFTIMAKEEVVNIKEYRQKQKAHPEKEVIPNIVVIVDEFADLISNNAKEVEPLIQRIAQKARAAGIYLIVATQRPSVNVITGDIKANIPARIALSVSSTFDSKTILDEFGAETLIGKGDLLARIPSSKALIRVQSAYVDNNEISMVTNYLKEQQKPNFNPEFLNLKTPDEEEAESQGKGGDFNKASMLHDKFREDPMYQSIKDYVIGSGVASTSSIMRVFGLGYGRAAAFLDTLEDDGIIATKAGGRKIVIANRPE